jgi:hypothetical protein
VLAGGVTIQAQRIEAQHRIDRLDAALLEADELHRVLRAEVAVAESPEVVMQAAKELGMVEPGPVLPLVPPAPEDPASSTDASPSDESASADAGVALGTEAADEVNDAKVVAGGG